MKYDDTHVNEAALSVVNGSDFDMAVMADESGKPMRYLCSCPPLGVPYVRRESWRRLVVHVADCDAPGLQQRLLDALGVDLMDVPF
ncbi:MULTISPECIES: hypothetical protein [unclassified Roseateles]|uniref:hypothetical protein n=1 Tax=unclassified Roseateles TaxID=2626991 RepID=UPI0006FC4675|nr:MULTISPECIES: hypothetical protein [unclassified Roseateles]KQW51213.1 hypothetical protein ASC81_00725 [Pelomonas sp. Root405]KRA77445.1 hypothetical protein ASD88_00725 [Pelomonas sp. Root662]